MGVSGDNGPTICRLAWAPASDWRKESSVVFDSRAAAKCLEGFGLYECLGTCNDDGQCCGVISRF